MPPSADVIRADFDRIAICSREVPDRVEAAAHRLVAEVPLRSTVLEIGCGTGALARELAARRGARVVAIDLSPRMVDVARTRTPVSLGIEYKVADFLTLSPRGFDIVISTNTLHHLPMQQALATMADAVSDHGKVLIADLFLAKGLVELPYNGLSWLLRGPRAQTRELAAAWEAHGEHDHLMSLVDLRRELRQGLPGVCVRRHLGWRYSAIWTK